MSALVNAVDAEVSEDGDADAASILNEHRTSFMALPRELRVLIYNLLPANQRKIMRLVNHQIKLEVEQNVDFDIRVDPQSFRACRRLMNLRVSSCTILGVTSHNSKKLNLRYPGRLRRIVFDGGVPASTVHKILDKCHRLRELTFTHEALYFSTKLSKCRRLKSCLENLANLTHLNLQFTRYPRGDPFSSEDNITFFLESTFPNLTSFKLCYSVWGSWLDLFLFITRHVGSLKSLELQVGDRNDASNTIAYLAKNKHSDILDIIERPVLSKLRLRDFRFRDDVLYLNPTVQVLVFDILRHQTTLEKFHFYSPGDMSLEMFLKIIESNQKTLAEIAVYNLKGATVLAPGAVPAPTSLDMSIFSGCGQLQDLAISCVQPPSVNQVGPPLQMVLMKMGLLPESLKRIHLTGFSFEEGDIIAASRKLTNLQELLIAEAGSLDFLRILISFIVHSPLTFISISPLKIRAMEMQDMTIEFKELGKLYQRFMQVQYDPMEDELNGFEARDISEVDRQWVKENLKGSFTSTTR